MIKSYKAFHKFGIFALLIGSIIRAAEPTFHLKNNSADAIQIDIMQNNKSLTGLKRVAKGGEFEFILDTSKPTTVDINYCPTAAYCKTNLPDKMIAKFKAGKTIYVKFDGKKVQPQKGNVLTGKTTAGYSSKNNVEKSDISIQASSTSKESLGFFSNNAVEVAWATFPAANALRKSEGISSDNPIVAQKILGVQQGDSHATIKKAYHKLSLKYHPDKYEGKKEVAVEISKILSSARDTLINPPSSAANSDMGRQELIQLFDTYPNGHKSFADPIYEQLTSTGTYNKALLLEIRNKVRAHSGLPADWKKQVLTTIDSELKKM